MVPPRTALVAGTRRYTFGDLAQMSARAANAFRGLGLTRGQRLAIMLPPGLEFAVSLLGAARARLITVPVSTQFGPDGLGRRLLDSEARLLVTNAEGREKLAAAGIDPPPEVLDVGADGSGFSALLANASEAPGPDEETPAGEPFI